MSTRTPGQRAGLTRPAVLDAARALLARDGLAGLTMRALAERLGVAPNALYSHVENKSGLVDDVLDDVLAEVEAPDPEAADPADGLHALMASTHAVLLAHPDLVPLYLHRGGANGPNAQRLGEVMLALLARADVTGPEGREALRVLIVYTIGFAAFAQPPTEELKANFDAGLRWLLSGIIRS